MADEDNVNCKIYVGSLSYDTNNEKLKEFFEKVGPVVKGKCFDSPYALKQLYVLFLIQKGKPFLLAELIRGIGPH